MTRVDDVLEIGCHEGLLSEKILGELKPKNFIPSDVKVPKNNLDGFQCFSGENLPFSEESFDLIISGGTFQWFDELERSLHSMVSLLKPGGVLSFSIFLEGSMSPWLSNYLCWAVHQNYWNYVLQQV